ncbi:hypothetical protein K474DRAFT_640090 [Panus rudis PR-1116 ss-1]|nr:hypothetical protein K474DRAFT_640090 [Panus rudis PR-1116 ss-1]
MRRFHEFGIAGELSNLGGRIPRGSTIPVKVEVEPAQSVKAEPSTDNFNFPKPTGARQATSTLPYTGVYVYPYSTRPLGTLDPLSSFFARYPRFHYRPRSPARKEFQRMCDVLGWTGDAFKDERDQAYDLFQKAMVQQFNEIYGMDERNITSWQYLCEILRIDPIPSTPGKCRHAIRGVHVNLVDLVDTHRTGEEVQLFSSLEELRAYTHDTRKFFPLHDAHAGGILKYLLRKLAY